MVIIDELTTEQIRNPEVFEKVKELVNPFVFHVQAKDAYFLQQKLETLLETSDLASLEPEAYKKYQDLITQLKWIALLVLPNEEVLKVLEESYLIALESEDIDVLDRIEAKMLSLGLMPRNELRREMQGALKKNKERIGSRTFGEWLLDYSKTFDFRDRDEFTTSKYVSQNPEAQALSESEKDKLRKALSIFDKALLITPVMDKFALGILLQEMIKAGTIKRENVSPNLLQSFSIPIEKPEITRIITKAAARSRIERETEEARLQQEISRKPKKPKKPGFFKRLFKKKPKKLKEKEEFLPPKIKEASQRLKSIPPVYEGKISPYERKEEEEKKPTHIGRIIPPLPKPPIEKTIPTFPEKEIPTFKPVRRKQKEKDLEKPKATPTIVKKTDIKGKYKIRTMKKDIEQAKGQITPSKTKPKVKNNVVDLSKK